MWINIFISLTRVLNISDNLSHDMAVFDHREITSVGLARSPRPLPVDRDCVLKLVAASRHRHEGRRATACIFDNTLLIGQIGGRYLVILCNKITGLYISLFNSWDFVKRNALQAVNNKNTCGKIRRARKNKDSWVHMHNTMSTNYTLWKMTTRMMKKLLHFTSHLITCWS